MAKAVAKKKDNVVALVNEDMLLKTKALELKALAHRILWCHALPSCNP